MTAPNAFDREVLAKRDRRGRRWAALRHAAGRGGFWLIAMAASALLVAIVAGFAEAPRRDMSFAMPWNWLGGALSGRVAMHRLTGLFLMLFIGGWLAVGGLALVRRMLSFEPLASTSIGSALTVARAGLDEAIRNRTVVVLVTLLLAALAAQPFLSAGTIEQPLRYRIQFFLSFSAFASALLLGGVTIFTAAAGVSGDLEGRRAGGVFVKPVPRWAYLLGRWIGAAAPAAVLSLVVAVVTWFGAAIWLAPQPALGEVTGDATDRDYVENRVLVAREEVPAMPDDSFGAAVARRLLEVRRDDPERFEQRGQEALAEDLLNEERTQFLALGFRETKTYAFRGMEAAYERAQALDDWLSANRDAVARQLNEAGIAMQPGQVSLESVLPYASVIDRDLTDGRLQMRFSIGGINSYGDSEGQLGLSIDGRQFPVTYQVDRAQVYDLPGTVIGDDGVLELDVINLGQVRNGEVRPEPIQFETDTWLSLFYNRGTFGGNLFR